MGFCQGSCNRSFQPPFQLLGVGIYSHGCKQGCFQPPIVQPAGASERAAVSDWPQDFGVQGGVAAGTDGTPGSLYLSASPAPWPWPVAGSGWPASPRSGRTPGPGERGFGPPGLDLAQGAAGGVGDGQDEGPAGQNFIILRDVRRQGFSSCSMSSVC